jgi:hypothetical protein
MKTFCRTIPNRGIMFFAVVQINSMPNALRLINLSERPTRSLKTPLKLKRVENPNPNRGSLMRAAPMIGVSKNKTPNKIWMMDGWKRAASHFKVLLILSLIPNPHGSLK